MGIAPTLPPATGHGDGTQGEPLHVEGATVNEEGGELQHSEEIQVEVQMVVVDVAIVSHVIEPEGADHVEQRCAQQGSNALHRVEQTHDHALEGSWGSRVCKFQS